MRIIYYFSFLLFSGMLVANDEVQSPAVDNGLNKDFYKDFWQIIPDSDVPEIIYKDPSKSDFYKEVILKSLTGYGSGVDKKDVNKDLYYKIEGVFACYLPDQTCSYNVTRPDKVDNVYKLKFWLEAIEQCYANSKYWDEPLKNAYGKRYKTKLEHSLNLECGRNEIDFILKQVSSSYISPDINSPVNALRDFYKDNLLNVHSILSNKLNMGIGELVVSINSSAGNAGEQEYKTFIDKDIIGKEEANTIFGAYTDVVTANLTSFPFTVFSRSVDDVNGSILVNGEIKALDQDKVSKVQSYRLMRINQLNKLNKDYVDNVRSFGILKQAAISGLSSIVNERFKEEKAKDSQLSAINSLIKKGLTLKSESDEKVNPVLILKQIRDNLALSNNLMYKRYLALERSQLALVTTQISQTKPLADRVNDSLSEIYRVAITMDAGDSFTSEVGQKPDVQVLK